MPFPQWYAGQVITAERLNARNMQMVTQEADMEIRDISVNSDNRNEWEPSEISLELEPDAIYAYWCYISYSAGPAGFAWSWSVSGVSLASFTTAYNRGVYDSSINTGGGVILRRPANTTTRVTSGVGVTDINSAYDRGTMETSGGTPTLTMLVSQDGYPTGGPEGTSILRGGNQTRFLYQRIA